MNRLLYVKSKAKLKQKTLTLTLTLNERNVSFGNPTAGDSNPSPKRKIKQNCLLKNYEKKIIRVYGYRPWTPNPNPNPNPKKILPDISEAHIHI